MTQSSNDEVRSISRDDFTIEHLTVGRKSRGDAIPVVKIVPRHFKNRLTILAHPRGKAALAGELRPAERSGAGAARSRARRGRIRPPVHRRVAGFPKARSPHRPETAHFETYNPSRAADQMQDLATVVAWAKSRRDVDLVNLIARDEAGYQALVARPMLEGLSRTVIELSGMPQTRKPDEWPATIDLAGLEQFGGPKAAAALSAPAPLWIYGNVGVLESAWPRAAYELAGSAPMLRIEQNAPSPAEIARWVDEGR